MTSTQTDTVLDTFGHVEIKHPFHAYRLSEAVALARNIASISGEVVNSMADARAVVARSYRGCGHTWITGAVAMDLLDAAIDGFDIKIGTRMIGSDTQPKDRDVVLKEYVSKVMKLENASVKAKIDAGASPTPLPAKYTPGMLGVYFDQGLSPEDAFKKITATVEPENSSMSRIGRVKRF